MNRTNIVIFAVGLIVTVMVGLLGYQFGKATPCADEESFEIHQLP